jgi:hypothetical protein
MRRSTQPTEILLGFAAGIVAAVVVEQPLVWFLHHLGLTARQAFSMQPVAAMGVPALGSRIFWSGVFGIALAWFGTRYAAIGMRWLVGTIVFTVGTRTAADWFILPMFWGHAWIGVSADRIVTPLLVNIADAAATAVLLAAMTFIVGTWGTRSLT